MSKQKKKLKSYLEAKGLEVLETEGNSGFTVRDPWGELDIPDLMDRIIQKENFDQAVRQVVSNGGAPGMDGMSVAELPAFVEEHWEEIRDRLRVGRYHPSPVRRVTIPKPDGGERNLGVPTVLDRAVQQAIAQVLVPIYEKIFSESSFGFRPSRSAHQAVTKLLNDYRDGYVWAVDIDLSKYFDTLNHEMLMNALRRTIHDETVLDVIKKFLKSGVMVDGVVQSTERGSPQGGNLSPLLANVYLHRFDELLENREHRFCRYADDIIILVRSERAAERVMASSVDFLENTMKLKVNTEKSRIAKATEVKYLGFTLYDYVRKDGNRKTGILIHGKSLKRFTDKIKVIINETASWSVEQVCTVVTNYVRGWMAYYGFADGKNQIEKIASWSRRKLRAKIWHQWKTPANRRRNLMAILPIPHFVAGCMLHARAHGSWHMSAYRPLHGFLSNEYLESLGFPDMLKLYVEAHSKW